MTENKKQKLIKLLGLEYNPEIDCYHATRLQSDTCHVRFQNSGGRLFMRKPEMLAIYFDDYGCLGSDAIQFLKSGIVTGYLVTNKGQTNNERLTETT